MNNPNTFVLGWGLFAAGTLGGAYLGYRRSQDQFQQRKIENIEHTRKRNETLDKLEMELRKNNSKLFRKEKQDVKDNNNTIVVAADKIIDTINDSNNNNNTDKPNSG